MRGKRTTVTIRRRVEGDRNAAGEARESWPAVTGGSKIRVHIQPLSMAGRAAMAQMEAGQRFASSHLAVFPKGTNVSIDDRLFVEPAGNQYVVQHVSEWEGHTEATLGVTNR